MRKTFIQVLGAGVGTPFEPGDEGELITQFSESGFDGVNGFGRGIVKKFEKDDMPAHGGNLAHLYPPVEKHVNIRYNNIE
ncbi:hypothetical protein hrd7_05430 [Leptolinea sp. HRD-7]|nr:hypothetical protein hrd7_05430 [Leptolinea sp. HRD-7]